MDKPEAERLYDTGKDPTVEKLLEQDQEIKTLKSKIAGLSTDSTNSSKPPSSDGPRVTRAKKKQSSRSRGGRKGHKGHKRELLPADKMDKIVDYYPSACENCAAPLNQESCAETSEPTRHQTFDLPQKIEPTKTEHRCHELGCACGHKTRAGLPAGIAQSQFGPRVHGAVAYLTSVHKIGRRGIVEIMNTLFGLELCLGSVCNCIDRISPELEPAAEQARRSLPQSANLNIDETGWKCKGDRRYLWVFVSQLVVYFTIAASRGAKVLQSVLGETFTGVITSDDHSAYACYHKNGLRQLCWAHLIRKFKGLKQTRGSPDAYAFAKYMLKEMGYILGCWHAFRQGFITRRQLLNATTLPKARMRRHCLKYRNSSDGEVVTRAKRTLRNWPHLFTFLSHDGVEPTNNIAEQDLRPAVQWRKLCFGNQSEAGERFTEKILTVTRTCQLHRKNPFHFLSDLMEAAFNGTPRPSLLY
jgi:transposase